MQDWLIVQTLMFDFKPTLMPCFTRMTKRFEPRLAALLLALCLSAACAKASDVAEPTARELHTADCIAALETRSEDLARQIKAGQTNQRAALQSALDAAAAFIGQAYMQGDRDQERLENLKNSALQAQKTHSSAELAARQASCAQEGEHLLSQADVLSRFVISRLAARQMKRLLGD
jgi:hypothetical protein